MEDKVRVVKVERSDGFEFEVECYDKNGNSIRPAGTTYDTINETIRCPCNDVFMKPLPNCPMCGGTGHIQLPRKRVTYGYFEAEDERRIHRKVMFLKTSKGEKRIEIG
ncbi:MAG: hypothetical protein ACXQS2_01700 [Methermicoccaceae archaeon]